MTFPQKTKFVKIQIADYVWLDKSQRSWYLWLGNPFCVGKYIIPLRDFTEKEIIKKGIEINKLEKKRFKSLFPDTKWEVLKKTESYSSSVLGA